MHISEGVLITPILVAGAVCSLVGVGYGLHKMQSEDVPKTALLSSVFFVASLVHVPVGPANMHLVLNGLVGILLGWAAIPAIFTGLVLHALLFQFGGLTTLGINTVIMAFPAIVVFGFFRRGVLSDKKGISTAAAFFSGALAVLLSGLILSISLAANGEAFIPVAKVALAAHAPVMIIEGFITAFILSFLKKVKPEVFDFSQMEKSSNA